MQVVHLDYPITNKTLPKKIVLALGFFDGVHLGHQRIIAAAREAAKLRNLPLAVLTFDRHPKKFFTTNINFTYIDSLDEKISKMAKLGVDYVFVSAFNKEFSKIKPQEFVDNIIVKLGADTVVAGFDYTYGPKDTANMATLPKLARDRFRIIEVPKQVYMGEKIGSTEIRHAIENGDMPLAAKLMGTHYVMGGSVGHGLRNGHKLGFPTANLVCHDKKVIPKIGVYATKTKVANKWYESMTSVGYNVTIHAAKDIFIESYLFDFDEDIYDCEIVIKWYKYTRGEIKFADLPALKKQLTSDENEIRAYFKENG